MTTPIITVEQAGALAAKAALRLGVSVSVWDAADLPTHEAALAVASEDLYAEPGLQIAGREGDSTVQLAVMVQALYHLDLAGDPNATERRRLQDGGVTTIQQGKVSESYGPRRSGLCAAVRQLLARYRGAVSMR